MVPSNAMTLSTMMTTPNGNLINGSGNGGGGAIGSGCANHFTNGPHLFANIQPYYGILPQVVKKLPRVWTKKTIKIGRIPT